MTIEKIPQKHIWKSEWAVSFFFFSGRGGIWNDHLMLVIQEDMV